MKDSLAELKWFCSHYLMAKAGVLLVLNAITIMFFPESWEKVMSTPGDVFFLRIVYIMGLVGLLVYSICSLVEDWYAKKEMDKPYWQV